MYVSLKIGFTGSLFKSTSKFVCLKLTLFLLFSTDVTQTFTSDEVSNFTPKYHKIPIPLRIQLLEFEGYLKIGNRG